jgi:hypothetical protein
MGVDPVRELLELAPAEPSVEYRVMLPGRIPGADGCFDVVWVCLVLGGIVLPTLLYETVRELERVLAANGLLFLVENTSRKEDRRHWVFRSRDEYASLFRSVDLRLVGHYEDLGEEISVLAGRRR